MQHANETVNQISIPDFASVTQGHLQTAVQLAVPFVYCCVCSLPCRLSVWWVCSLPCTHSYCEPVFDSPTVVVPKAVSCRDAFMARFHVKFIWAFSGQEAGRANDIDATTPLSVKQVLGMCEALRFVPGLTVFANSDRDTQTPLDLETIVAVDPAFEVEDASPLETAKTVVLQVVRLPIQVVPYISTETHRGVAMRCQRLMPAIDLDPMAPDPLRLGKVVTKLCDAITQTAATEKHAEFKQLKLKLARLIMTDLVHASARLRKRDLSNLLDAGRDGRSSLKCVFVLEESGHFCLRMTGHTFVEKRETEAQQAQLWNIFDEIDSILDT